MNTSECLNELIKTVKAKCEQWLQKSEDGSVYFCDPNDQKEISAHYGATHTAAALILLDDEEGKKLLVSVLDRWETSKKLPGFHNDFNNFAMCIIWDHLHGQGEVCKRIENVVLNTPDSNHDTVNWLPMRWYVNHCREKWTGNKQYQEICRNCKEKIKQATYQDGFIDDQIPKGVSFNLQYDVATVAALQLLRCKGVELNLSNELGALLNAVAPDGDINYLGRGTNQIFAWGMWVFLLSSANCEEALKDALSLLLKQAPIMVEQNNMMLNGYKGEEKYLWWDYHYASVYTAHFLFWLVLAQKYEKAQPIQAQLSKEHDSGVSIYKDDAFFCVVFGGRSEYLAEKGPMVAALYTKNNGVICKGTFAPWQGAFGNRYVQPLPAILNYCGPICIQENSRLNENRILHKLHIHFNIPASIKLTHLFPEITVERSGPQLLIRYQFKRPVYSLFTLPVLNYQEENSEHIQIVADERQMKLNNTGSINNQYKAATLLQSKPVKAKNWTLILKA